MLDLDYYRFTQDIRGSSSDRKSYKFCLSNLLSAFVFSKFSEEIKKRLIGLANFLPYNFEEQMDNAVVTKRLIERAKFYAEYADEATYIVQPTENESIVTISHHSPSLNNSKNIEEQKKSVDFLSFNNIAYWAHKSLLQDSIVEGYSIQSALEFMKQYDELELFEDGCEGWTEESTHKRMKQNAVVAVATMALCFREALADTDLEWAREVINKILDLPFNSYECSTPEAKLTFHPKIFASKALASEIKFDTADDNSKIQI